MANVELRGLRLPVREPLWTEFIRKEDWWAVWISLGLIGVAIAKFASGGSLQWIAVAPQKWGNAAELAGQLRPQGIRYLALGLLWAVLFGTGAAALGLRFSQFLTRICSTLSRCGGHLCSRPVGSGLALQPRAAAGCARAGAVDFEYRRSVRAGSNLRCGWSSTSRPASCCSVRACRSRCLPGRVRWPSCRRRIVSLVTFGVIYFRAVRLGSRPAVRRDAGNGRRGLRRIRRHRHRRGGGREEGARLGCHLAGDLLGHRDDFRCCRWSARALACRRVSPAPGSERRSLPMRRAWPRRRPMAATRATWRASPGAPRRP